MRARTAYPNRDSYHSHNQTTHSDEKLSTHSSHHNLVKRHAHAHTTSYQAKIALVANVTMQLREYVLDKALSLTLKTAHTYLPDYALSLSLKHAHTYLPHYALSYSLKHAQTYLITKARIALFDTIHFQPRELILDKKLVGILREGKIPDPPGAIWP